MENGESLSVIKEIINEHSSLKLKGLHLHIGTSILNPDYYKKAVLNLLLFIREVEKLNIKIDYIDLGGGFPSKDACPLNEKIED